MILVFDNGDWCPRSKETNVDVFRIGRWEMPTYEQSCLKFPEKVQVCLMGLVVLIVTYKERSKHHEPSKTNWNGFSIAVTCFG